jgi:hypothetical protein
MNVADFLATMKQLQSTVDRLDRLALNNVLYGGPSQLY